MVLFAVIYVWFVVVVGVLAGIKYTIDGDFYKGVVEILLNILLALCVFGILF